MSSNFLILCSASDTNSSLVSWIFFSSPISCFLRCLKSWHWLSSLWCFLNRSSYLCCSAPSSFSTQVAFSEKKRNYSTLPFDTVGLWPWWINTAILWVAFCLNAQLQLIQCNGSEMILPVSSSFQAFVSCHVFFFWCCLLLSVCGRTAG